jgi:hypothetical protein
MATTTYQGIDPTEPKEFTPQLVETLMGYYAPRPGDHEDTENNFAQAILTEARWAISELEYHRHDRDRKSVRAERDNVLKGIKKLGKALRTMSRDFDVLLGNDADPLGCTDKMTHLASQIESRVTDERLDSLPKKLLPNQAQSRVSKELTIRILRVLKRYGVSTAITCDPDLGYISDAVRILKTVGDAIGLDQEYATWRNIMSRAKHEAGI